MRFVHIADVHLGASPEGEREWAADRSEEIRQSFYRVLDWCVAESIDLLVIAGDLFHRQPTVRELKELNYRFSKLEKMHVVLIAGNHDYIGASSAYRGFDWSRNVVMLDAGDMDSVFFEELNTEVYGFSYYTRNIYEARYDAVYPGVEERINILLAHGGDEKNIPLNRRKLSESGFDYIALGHIHKPEILGARMAYSGSLEPLDKTEGGEHGFVVGEIAKNGTESEIMLQFVPFCTRQYISLTLTSDPDATNASLLEEAKERMLEAGMEHMFRIRLVGVRDREIAYEPDAFLRLGRVVEVLDETRPDYDFAELERENEDTIIGMYIRRLRELEAEGSEQSGIVEKALYYGIDAMLRQTD